MGEDLTLFSTEFNGSLRIESRAERLTGEAGAIILRERLGVVRWMTERLRDPRDPRLVTHPLTELLRTAVLLMGQGWRDRDDADALRDDAALRPAVSDRRGISPLLSPEREEDASRPKNPAVPDGLASQPTLSRLVRMLAGEENRSVLREAILETAARRIKAGRGGHRMRYATIDVDGLPVEVHGHQPGSEYNGHYHARIYHPIVASLAETGDLVDIRLRPGNVHGAEGALEFVTSLVERVLVVLERPGELFLHHFWLITSWSEEQMHAEDLLELYRERGTAEGHFGELMSVIEPALSSSPRQKSHYAARSRPRARCRATPSRRTRRSCCSTPSPTTWPTPRACSSRAPPARAGACAACVSGCCASQPASFSTAAALCSSSGRRRRGYGAPSGRSSPRGATPRPERHSP